MNLQKMTKKQLDNHAETIGIKLDRRKSKKDMITELNKKLKAKKAPAKKPKKAKNSLPPAPRMVPEQASEKGFWATLKGFFGQ
jgi:hypothetical protein